MQRNETTNCQNSLDHGKGKRIQKNIFCFIDYAKPFDLHPFSDSVATYAIQFGQCMQSLSKQPKWKPLPLIINWGSTES